MYTCACCMYAVAVVDPRNALNVIFYGNYNLHSLPVCNACKTKLLPLHAGPRIPPPLNPEPVITRETGTCVAVQCRAMRCDVM